MHEDLEEANDLAQEFLAAAQRAHVGAATVLRAFGMAVQEFSADMSMDSGAALTAIAAEVADIQRFNAEERE